MSVMVTGRDAETAVMLVALPWVMAGGLARVSKERGDAEVEGARMRSFRGLS